MKTRFIVSTCRRCDVSCQKKTTKTAPTLESLHRGANEFFRRIRSIQFKRGGTGKAIVTERAVIFNTSTSSVVRAYCTAISQLVFHTTVSSCCSLNGLLTALSRFQISLLYVSFNKTSAPRQVILGHQITISNSWPLRRRYYGVVSSTKSLGSAIVPLRMKVEQRFNRPAAHCRKFHRYFFSLSFCVRMRRGHVFAEAMPKAGALHTRSPSSAV